MLEDGAGAQQSDRRGGQEQRAVHPTGVRGGRGRSLQRGRLQAPRVRAAQTLDARHTQAGPQVLHLLAFAHRHRVQGPVHFRSAMGVLHRPPGRLPSHPIPSHTRTRLKGPKNVISNFDKVQDSKIVKILLKFSY